MEAAALDEKLSRMEDRLEALSRQLERVTALLEGSAALPAAVVSARAADPATAERMSDVLVQLGDPEVLESLGRIAGLVPQLEYVAHGLAAGPELLEDALAIARDQLRDGSGQDLQPRVLRGLQVARSLARPEILDAVERLGHELPTLSGPAHGVAEAVAALEAVHGPLVRERVSEAVLQLGDPEVLEAITRIVSLAPQLEYAAYAVAAGPTLLEEGLDLLRSRPEFGELEPRFARGLEVARVLARREVLDGVEQLVASVPAVSGAGAEVARAFADLERVHGSAVRERLVEAVLRVGDPEVLESLTRIASLAPEIEYSVTALAAGPTLLEEALEQVRAHLGADANELGRVLADPAVLAAVLRMARALPEALPDAAMLERLTKRLPWVDAQAGRLQRLFEAADREAGPQGMDPRFERLGRAMAHVTDARVLDALEQLAVEAPRLQTVLPQLLDLATTLEPLLVEPRRVEALRDLLSLSGKLAAVAHALPEEPETLALLHAANAAVARSTKSDIPSPGLFGLVGALNDPDVRRVLGLGIVIAKHLSPHLKQVPVSNK